MVKTNRIYLALITLILPRFRLSATNRAVLTNRGRTGVLELAGFTTRTAQRATEFSRVGTSLEKWCDCVIECCIRVGHVPWHDRVVHKASINY